MMLHSTLSRVKASMDSATHLAVEVDTHCTSIVRAHITADRAPWIASGNTESENYAIYLKRREKIDLLTAHN